MSAPVRTPGLFMYPGGKTWFLPHARRWLASLGTPVPVLHEPFAGGAVVSLCALLEGLAVRVVLVEWDPDVAAVWKTLARGHGALLAAAVRARGSGGPPVSLNGSLMVRRALRALVNNRTKFGGIVWRNRPNRPRDAWRSWHPEDLAVRLEALHPLSGRLHAVEGDGLRYLAVQPAGAYFVDPPYPIDWRDSDARIYRFDQVDPERVFTALASFEQPFLLTYNDVAPIRALARRFGLRYAAVPMHDNLLRARQELVITNGSLEWLDG